MEHSHVGIFSSIPKWARTLFGNGLVTEPSPYGNGDVSILLASMRHVQLNGNIVEKINLFDKKIRFLTGKSVFLARKSNFWQENSVSMYTTSVHAQISLMIFSNHKTGIPFFHSRMCQVPFSYGVPSMETGACYFKSPYGNEDSPFPYGDVSIPVSIWGSPYGNVYGSQFFWQCNGAWCMTQWPAQTTVPV